MAATTAPPEDEAYAATATTDVPTRLARLEGAYQHLATKADLQALETRMEKALHRQTRILVATVIAVGTLMVAALKLIPPV